MKKYIVTKRDMEHCVRSGLEDVFKDSASGMAMAKIIFNAIEYVLDTVLEDDCDVYDEGL